MFLATCEFSKHKQIPLGVWRVDSVYTHYNGFSFMRKDVSDEPLTEYLPGGKLKMTKGNESRFFRYDLRTDDSLFHSLHGNVTEKFFIEKSDEDQLILRRSMNPLFGNKDQVRFEVRFMSKLE